MIIKSISLTEAAVLAAKQEADELKSKDVKPTETKTKQIDIETIKVGEIGVKTMIGGEQLNESTLKAKLLETTSKQLNEIHNNIDKIVENNWKNVVKSDGLASEPTLMSASSPVGHCKLTPNLENVRNTKKFPPNDGGNRKKAPPGGSTRKMDGSPHYSTKNEKPSRS